MKVIDIEDDLIMFSFTTRPDVLQKQLEEVSHFEILIVEHLYVDSVLHGQCLSNLPMNLKLIMIHDVYSCDLESFAGYKNLIKPNKIMNTLIDDAGLKLPFGCEVYYYKEFKLKTNSNNDNILYFSGTKKLY